MKGKNNLVRLENTDEDFAKRGVKRGPVEIWEDARRDTDEAGHYEWWYFDFMMDDGTKVVIHFHTKPVRKCKNKGYVPSPGIGIYLPDGTKLEEEPVFKANEIRLADDHCDVTMGPHHVEGNLRTYTLHYEPSEKNGLGADLVMKSLSKPWRPGNAYFFYPGFCCYMRVFPGNKIQCGAGNSILPQIRNEIHKP